MDSFHTVSIDGNQFSLLDRLTGLFGYLNSHVREALNRISYYTPLLWCLHQLHYKLYAIITINTYLFSEDP